MPKVKRPDDFVNVIKVSDVAAEKIKHILENTDLPSPWVKIDAKRDDCGCIDYRLTFEKQPTDDDKVVKDHDLRIFIDQSSVELLRGSEMGFAVTPEGEGFTFKNPNSEHTG
jgi:iron-sulfur cluster assembly protein